MSRDDIIRLAREAGFSVWDNERASMEGDGDALERFAALVAAAEREACAKVADDMTPSTRARMSWRRGAPQQSEQGGKNDRPS